MKKSKFTESQIIKALKENESGRSVEEITRADQGRAFSFAIDDHSFFCNLSLN